MAFTFVNPYNFIPLANDKGKKRGPAADREQLLSGKIKYTIKTVTPLFVPNTSNDRYFDIKADNETEEEYHKSYDFFSYNDLKGLQAKDGIKFEPVIPGSEIRGAVRSIYEALTDSCFSASDSDSAFSRRTPQRYKPGILEHTSDGTWRLATDVKDYICRNSNDFSLRNEEAEAIHGDGIEVRFNDPKTNKDRRGKPLAYLDTDGRKSGYLIKGNDGPVLAKSRGSRCPTGCPRDTQDKCRANGYKTCYKMMKHNYHVFCDKGPKKKNVPRESIDQFSEVLRLYQLNTGKAYDAYIERWEEVKNSKKTSAIPVYYDIPDPGETVILLSPACITREVYRNTLKTILGEHYNTCSSKSRLCPACQLFGIVNPKGGLQRTSNLRFSDLSVVKQKEYYSEPLTLDELGTPKPSTMEFYLKKPEVKLEDGQDLLVWTYDYYVTVDSNGNTEFKLYDPVLAGRKMYWHSRKAAGRQLTMKQAIEKEKKHKADSRDHKDMFITKRNKTVRPVRENVEFTGFLYFDKISETELRRLIAILNMSAGKEGRKEYAMKLGAAKPLGFGSVKTRVDRVELRRLSEKNDTIGFEENAVYEERPLMPEEGLFESATEENLELFNLNAVDESKYTVHYPYIDREKALAKEEEGFKWFGENRKGFVKGKPSAPGEKKTIINIKQTTNGPGERIQIPFRSYLQATEPALKTNFKTTGNGGADRPSVKRRRPYE